MASFHKGEKATGNSSALYAAALQQHLSRQFMISDDEMFLQRLNSLNSKKVPSVKHVKAVVDSGRKKPTGSLKSEPKREYVITAARTKPDLAEKLGIVGGGPKGRLDETTWKSTKIRSEIRGDFGYPCPICQEHFALKPTLLLSCSHVFHRACLDAFERFSGKQSCPVCRATGYEKRVVFEGEYSFMHLCATRIQTCWRGYRARRRYQHYRQHHPPQNPKLKETWCLERLTQITSQCVDQLQHQEQEVDAFLRDLDTTLDNSRATFSQWDTRNLRECEWSAVEEQCHRRESSQDGECAICLCKWNRNKQRVLLSCSHLFHEVCLANVERMSVWNGAAAFPQVQRTCPLCRSPYTKKLLPDLT